MKERLFATMLLFACILSLASCSKDDGDWDAMKWEKNNYEEALTPSFGKAIGVPKSGGTYTFKCKNYKNFWIEYVNESVGGKTIKNVPSYEDKPYSEVKGSYTSSKVEGNTLTVTFAPNETQDGRYVRVAVSAGDISCCLHNQLICMNFFLHRLRRTSLLHCEGQASSSEFPRTQEAFRGD